MDDIGVLTESNPERIREAEEEEPGSDDSNRERQEERCTISRYWQWTMRILAVEMARHDGM